MLSKQIKLLPKDLAVVPDSVAERCPSPLLALPSISSTPTELIECWLVTSEVTENLRPPQSQSKNTIVHAEKKDQSQFKQLKMC